MGEINTILEKRNTTTDLNNEQTLCEEQIKYLREENSSKNLIIKILSENQNAFNGCLPQQSKSYEAFYDSKVPFIDPKKMVKYHKKKGTPHNFLSPNCFSTLDFKNDVMIMENNSHDKDPGSYTKENTDKRQNLLNMTNVNRKSNFRPSICTTGKYLQNHSYSNTTRHQRRKAVVIGDSHLNQINMSRFKNNNVGHTVYFKCFSGSNTKQLNYYANRTLVDEQPNTVVVHIGSNDINKFNYSKVDVEDLGERIIDIGKKYKSYCVSNIAISSILVRKNHEVNEVIKKLNNLLRTLCLEQGFTFIFNSAISRAMLWHDGLHLTNEGTKILSNNFLQYLKNVPLGNGNRIFTD